MQQQVMGNATERPLAQPAMPIGARDQHVGILFPDNRSQLNDLICR